MQRKTELGGKFQDERDDDIPDHIKEINELIRKAQNRNGSVPRQQRDEALMELCRRFANLIKRHAKRVYRSASGYDLKEWHHDAITTFIELVISDYRLKEDGGSAFFGTYITQKLYFRLLYKSQESVLHYRRQGTFDPQHLNLADACEGTASDRDVTETLYGNANRNRKNKSDIFHTNEERFDIGINDDGAAVRSVLRDTPTEVFGAMVATFHANGADEPVVTDDRRREIVAQAVNILQTAKRVLSERDYDIFEWRFASGLTGEEIAQRIKPALSTRSINRIAQTARERVLVELGRQSVGKALT